MNDVSIVIMNHHDYESNEAMNKVIEIIDGNNDMMRACIRGRMNYYDDAPMESCDAFIDFMMNQQVSVFSLLDDDNMITLIELSMKDFQRRNPSWNRFWKWGYIYDGGDGFMVPRNQSYNVFTLTDDDIFDSECRYQWHHERIGTLS